MSLERDRFIRETILRVLKVGSDGGNPLGYCFTQIRDGFTNRSAASADEVGAALRYLEDSKLIAAEWNQAVGENWYRLTPAGIDFTGKHFPWDKLEAF